MHAGMCSLDDRDELWLLTERMDYSLYHALQRRGLRWWNGCAAHQQQTPILALLAFSLQQSPQDPSACAACMVW